MKFKIGIIVKMNIISEKWVEHRVSTPGRHNFLPYYTTSPWSADESFFVFYSVLPDFSRVWLGTYSVAGGETSSAVSAGLGVRSMRIWQEIEPGVPLMTARCEDSSELMLVLKSGSFGSDGFLSNAVQLMRRASEGHP